MTYDSFCYGSDRSRISEHRFPDYEALKDPASRDIFSSTSKFARFAKVKPYVLVESEGNKSVKNKKTNISVDYQEIPSTSKSALRHRLRNGGIRRCPKNRNSSKFPSVKHYEGSSEFYRYIKFNKLNFFLFS